MIYLIIFQKCFLLENLLAIINQNVSQIIMKLLKPDFLNILMYIRMTKILACI